MDFFNKLTDAVNKAVDKASSPEARKAVDHATDLIGEKANAVIENLFGSNTYQTNTAQASARPAATQVPSRAKPSVKRSYETYMYDSENGDKEYKVLVSFMLSGDFVLSRTNAGEIEKLYLYDPDCSEEFTPYELNDPRPYIFISPDIDEVYCSVNDYLESGKVNNAVWVQPSEHPNMLFRAKFDYYGDIMVMYGYKRYDGTPCGLCLVYKKDLDGTELCGRLLTQLDEAAASCREEKISE